MAGEIEAYIRAAAVARGINPDVAVRIARTEGGLEDPFQQSYVKQGYGREESYGPFQLHLRGGLGAQALAAGIDPRKDWKGGVDFALDTAARNRSWSHWYGARDNGIPNSAGFTEASHPVGARGTTLNSTSRHVGGAGSAPGYFAAPEVAPAAPVAPAAETPVAEAPPPATIQESLKQDLAKDDEDSVLSGLVAANAKKKAADAEAFAQFSQIQPSNLDVGGGGSGQAAAGAAALMQAILQKRRQGGIPGLSLMGVGTG
jgi:hypothetical protein